MKKCLLEPNKNRYNTQRDAETQILMSNKKDLRAYYCATCQGWHLTSK